MKSNLTAHGASKRINGDLMGHDELLAKIDNELEINIDRVTLVYLPALRAVVELHKPYQDHVVYCQDCERIYPCTTIQAIEKELK